MPTAVSYLPTIFFALSLVVLAKLWSEYRWSRKYKLPPGPKGVPYFGNMFQMPAYHQGPWAKELAEKYGEMFTIKIASNTWVFLNSPRTITDLLEKRSAIYSSRPRYPYASALMSGSYRMVIQPYGPHWRAVRKIMHSILNGRNAPTFAPFQDLESKQLVYDVLRQPDLWWKANQRFANSVVMSVAFGKRVMGTKGEEEGNIKRLFDTSQEFIAALQPGANAVDTFYFLDKLPGWAKWWRRRGEAAFARLVDVYGAEVRDLERRVENGTCRECFATRFLRDPAAREMQETQRLFTLGSLMEAGSDTSRMVLSQIVAAAATDARWVVRAQEEIDRVCGFGERLPEFADRAELRYLSAVAKEGFRWRPFAEIGMPHMLIQDDEYEGYRFPAGTLFTWNSWHVALDEVENPDALRFWPERWLDPSIQGFDAEKLEDPLAGHWSFGAGRRVCSGYHVGDSNVWIAAARLLCCFEFEQVAGKEVDTVNMNVAEHRWAPFEVRIRVRSGKHRGLVERVGGEVVGVEY